MFAANARTLPLPQYVRTVIEICKHTETKSLKIKELEVNVDSSKFADNQNIDVSELEEILRLILREDLWCKLVSKKLKFHFGYDYYMYLIISDDFTLWKDAVSDSLYIEDFKSPYL